MLRLRAVQDVRDTQVRAVRSAVDEAVKALDRFRALWLIRYRQDVADTDAMAQYKDVCVSPALVAVALGGKPFPDYSIKYTDPAGVTKRMDQLLDVATFGIGAVHPAVGDYTQNGLRDADDVWWMLH